MCRFFFNIFCCMWIAHCCPAQYKKYSFWQPKMGMPFGLIIYASDSAKAAVAAEKAYALVDTLNQLYSDYLPSSELNRLCASAGSGEWVKVSAPLFNIIRTAITASSRCEGSFDITVGPLARLWRKARKEKKFPSPDSLALARQRVGYRFVLIDTLQQRICLMKKGMQLDLGGIAQGDVAQRVYELLRKAGLPHALVDASGDIVAGTTPSGVPGWKVGINLPESEALMNRSLLLQQKSVSTSGDLYQYVELNGKRYSHIIDPKTGLGVTRARNVTVIANDGITADWLTKACTLLPIPRALILAGQFPGVEVQIAILKKGKVHYYRTAGFCRYFGEKN